MDVLSEQSIRILRLFGNTTATKVTSTVGPEQEYFLIDKAMYDKREDLYDPAELYSVVAAAVAVTWWR